ncbi:MAG: glycosyltransferase, partial [Herbiconiux sp.]|nr:glycosyltransferase [Herbiconiux sp.]
MQTGPGGTEPAYAVVIPAFNAERHIAETIASVFDQTLPPASVVVVDDGSTDRTAIIASAA